MTTIALLIFLQTESKATELAESGRGIQTSFYLSLEVITYGNDLKYTKCRCFSFPHQKSIIAMLSCAVGISYCLSKEIR